MHGKERIENVVIDIYKNRPALGGKQTTHSTWRVRARIDACDYVTSGKN